MPQNEQILQDILAGLMRRYKERVPDVGGILEAMVKENIIHDTAEIENDHIAFRTLGVDHLGIQSLEKIFLHYGYRRMDKYFFREKTGCLLVFSRRPQKP